MSLFNLGRGLGTNDPFSVSVRNNKLSVLEWKARYLYGVPDTDPATGEAFPVEDYQYHLDLGYQLLSSTLNMPILPSVVEDERHDYYASDYAQWAWIHLNHYPARRVLAIKGKFPQNDNVVEFPSTWAVLDGKAGHLQLVPSSGNISQWMIGQSGSFLPLLARGGYLPGFWSIDYEVGFEDGKIPIDVTDAAAKFATMSVCSILGDLLGGVGVLGGSIGLDGLSQFVSLTKTATTSGFYSRILQYRTDLFGSAGGGISPGSQLHTLKRRYVGIRMSNM